MRRRQEPTSATRSNNATALFATVQGVMVGAIGAIHGASAAFRGFTNTDGFVMATVGAVTFIPNYLITGVAAIVVGACIVLWTVLFIHSRTGPTVFLILSVLLAAVGGGVAHIPFFLIGWAVATRISSSLSWWKRAIPTRLAERLARGWLVVLVVDYSLLFIGIAIWLVFLPSGSTNRSPPTLQYACWLLIGAGLLMQLPTIVSGFMRDLQRRRTTNEL